MKQVINIIGSVVKNAPKIRHYVNLAIQILDSIDGVQDWVKNNPIEQKKK